MTLRHTLKQIHEHHQRVKGAGRDNVKVLEEWQEAVAALLADLRKYLAEYETDGTLSFFEESLRLIEDDLGSYSIKTLKIMTGPITISVEPVGRFVGETQGRVDMFCRGQLFGTNDWGDQRVMFIRRLNDGDGSLPWHIRLPRSRRRMLLWLFFSQNRSVPLNKSNVDSAVKLLLNGQTAQFGRLK